MKLILKITAGIVLAFVVLIAGCAALVGKSVNDATKSNHHYSVHIYCGCHWSGSAGNASYDGYSDRIINFKDMAITAAVFQKEDGGHYQLEVDLVKDGKIIDIAKTTAAYGVVSVSGSDF